MHLFVITNRPCLKIKIVLDLYPDIDPNDHEDNSPFDPLVNHGLQFKSGMVQTWNKFCFTTGYIEISVIFPGPNENAQGYVSPSSSSMATGD